MALNEQQRQAIRHPFRWLFSSETENPDEIPRKELSFFALGLMGQNEVYNMAGTNAWFHFCTNVLKLKPTTVGKMTGAVTIFDALNDPVAGALIDRFRFKDGQKLLPWIKYTSPFVGILAFFLFINWNIATPAQTVIYCTVVYLLWDIIYSFQDIALWGITATISPNSGQRARATQWADIGAFLSILMTGTLTPMLSGDGAFGFTQQQIYFAFSLVLCLGGGFQSMFAVLTTERVRSLPEEVVTADGRKKKKSIFSGISVLRHNHVLLLFLLSEMLRNCTPYVNEMYIFQQMSFPFMGKDIPAPLLLTIMGALTGIPGSAMKFFATKIADRVGGMKRVLMIGCITGIITKVLQFTVGIKTLPMFLLMLSLEVINQLPQSIYMIAQRTMISDSVEYVEWKTGQRTEGITMSIRNLTSKAASAVQRYVQGLCLNFLQFNAHNVDMKLPQNAHFHQWVWPVYKLGSALGVLFALLPLLLIRYPDSLKQKVETEMAERRALSEELEAAVEV